VAAFVTTAAVTVPPVPPAAAAPNLPLVRVIESPTGGSAGGADLFLSTELSLDGRYVSFATAAPVTHDAVTGWENAFIRDLDERRTTQVSFAPGRTQPDSFVYAPSMSADGSVLAFSSPATNLDPADTDGNHDIYVYRRSTDEVEWISRHEPEPGDSVRWWPFVSGNGRYVFYSSDESDLFDDPYPDGLVRYDLQTGAVRRAMVDDAGTPGWFISMGAVSYDGRRLLVLGDMGEVDGEQPSPYSLFVHDLGTGDTTLVPGGESTELPNGDLLIATGLALSDDGRYAYYEAGLDADRREVRRADLSTGAVITLPGGGWSPHVSPNGATVAYTKPASGTSGPTQVYAYDVATGTTRLVSQTPAGAPGNGDSTVGALSRTGRFVTVISDASDLVTGDVNGEQDLYRADLGAVPDVPRSPRVSIGSTTVSVSWTAPIANGTPSPTGYRVQMSEGGIDDSVDESVDATGTTVTFDDLVAGQGYRFSVAARNGNGLGAYTPYTAFVIPPFATPDAFVQEQFQAFRQRAATRLEVSWWANDVFRHQTSAAVLINSIVSGGPLDQQISPVARLYSAAFLRAPDSGGLRYWIGRRNHGFTLSRMASVFAASSEFRTRYGALSNRDFVTRVYRNVLGRDADAGGLAYWTDRLDRRITTRGDLIVSFSEASEGKRRLAPTTDAILVSWGMLGRVPNVAELVALRPLTRTKAIEFLLATPAYWGRHRG
jgi:Tol biopolymer transport system component